MGFPQDVAALPGLVGYWRLGETAGTTAVNLQGNAAKDGTYTGGYTLNQTSLLFDTSDPSVSLNGTTGYVTIPDHDDFSLTTTGKLSIGMLIRPTAGACGTIMAKATASNWEYNIEWCDGFNTVIAASAGGTRAQIISATGTAHTTTYFYVMTADDDTDELRVYIDGKEDGVDTTWTGSSTNGTSPVDIGRRPLADQYTVGRFDEAFITNTVLSADKIRDLYSASVSAPPPPILGRQSFMHPQR